MLLSILPSTAFALRYNVGGKSENSDGNNTIGYGTYTYNWLANDPHLEKSDSAHLNSIYVRNALTGNYVEFGWYRKYGYSNPWGFAAWKINGIKDDEFLGSTADNRYVKLQIHSSPGTDDWIAFMDNVEIKRWNNSLFSTGIPQLGSERVNTGDDNFGVFKNLQFREGNVTWKYWRDIVEMNVSNADPNYYLDDDDTNHAAYSTLGP